MKSFASWWRKPYKNVGKAKERDFIAHQLGLADAIINQDLFHGQGEAQVRVLVRSGVLQQPYFPPL
jgi:hypothetical protein